MRILFDINHPADVHQFRNLIHLLERRGHGVRVIARDKDVTHALLDAYRIPYVRRRGYRGVFGKTLGMLKIDSFIYRQCREFRPDILIGSSGDCYIAQVSRLIGKPSLIFSDTEFAGFQNALTFPFASKVITPKCFYARVGRNHVTYDGYKELAYLHPKYFTPDPGVPKKMGVRKGEKYAIIRLVSFQASHDFGYHGITGMSRLLDAIKPHCRVFITSETGLAGEAGRYRMDIQPTEMHSALSFASLLIGESSTMAAESAVLGTPAIFISDSHRGYTDEISERYKLISRYATSDIDGAVQRAKEILGMKDAKAEFTKRRDDMLREKIDVTQWMLDYIEGIGGHG